MLSPSPLGKGAGGLWVLQRGWVPEGGQAGLRALLQLRALLGTGCGPGGTLQPWRDPGSRGQKLFPSH